MIVLIKTKSFNKKVFILNTCHFNNLTPLARFPMAKKQSRSTPKKKKKRTF